MSDPGYCATCNNTGWVDCYCGGDCGGDLAADDYLDNDFDYETEEPQPNW